MIPLREAMIMTHMQWFVHGTGFGTPEDPVLRTTQGEFKMNISA